MKNKVKKKAFSGNGVIHKSKKSNSVERGKEMGERKYQKHRQYSIEEKNQIVLLYIDQHMSYQEITREYQLSGNGILSVWVKQYREKGSCIDNRGRGTKKEFPTKGRPKKHIQPLEEMSKKDLIEKIRMYEDIKKSLAYLMKEEQNNTIK